MKMTTLGQNGPATSQFGIGAMSFAGLYGDATEAQSHAVLDACLAAGVTHIDTANVYGMGRSEEIIGTWLAARPGARDQFTIATKAGITRRDGVRTFDNSLAHMEAELDASLKRLGTDHVDLFYAHRRDPDRPIEDIAGGMAQLIAKGKTRAIGFSEIAPSTLRRAAREHPVAAVQSEYSLSTRAPELGLVQACAEVGASLVAFSPVGRSLLTDAPFDAARIASIAFLQSNPRFMPSNLDANLAANAAFCALARDLDISAAGLAIAWVAAQGDHVLPIPGTSSVAHLGELLEGATRNLTSEELAHIDETLPVGWCHGDRYNADQWVGPERFC